MGDQERSFRGGLKNVNIWYAHQITTVLCLLRVAPGVNPYQKRGWTNFERHIGGFLHGSQFYHLEKVIEGQPKWKELETTYFNTSTKREPPMIPEAFDEFLEERT